MDTSTRINEMDGDYLSFLASKSPRAQAVGFDPLPMTAPLFGYQKAATEFCIKRGRAALFLDTGLGKTICELEFARQCAAQSNGIALILTPLAVAKQIEREGQRFAYDARVVRDQSQVSPGINICNYDRLELLDPETFGCVVLDESGILKSFTGKTTRALIQSFSQTQYRLAATATPAPNDHMELGQHAEFLGIMPSNEMLARWFISDQTQMGRYRLKGYAVNDFWDWMASWAIMAESPEDLGFDGSSHILPPMNLKRHKVHADVMATDGLFGFDVSATAIHQVKRQTSDVRAAAATGIIGESDKPWLIWVDTDYEADAVRAAIPDAVEIRGSMTPEKKEELVLRFVNGEITRFIGKPSMLGHGLNFQHCADMIFVGRSFSYEQWYQAVRRCWRFGQKRQVNVHIVVAEGEDQIGRVIDRKSEDHAKMKEAMRMATRRAIGRSSELKVAYDPTFTFTLPAWLASE